MADQEALQVETLHSLGNTAAKHGPLALENTFTLTLHVYAATVWSNPVLTRHNKILSTVFKL